MQSPVPCPLPPPLADPEGARDAPAPLVSMFYIFMQFCGNLPKIIGLRPTFTPFWEILDPPLSSCTLVTKATAAAGLYLRRVEVAVGDPVCVALAGHDDVSSGNRPHLPRVIVRRGCKDLLARVQCDSERKINTGLQTTVFDLLPL